MQQTSSTPYRLISLYFILILAAVHWGFYKTYIVFFPSFNGFNIVHHFHGIMMITWLVMLIIQPLLIRSGKITWHRLIGKISFVVAPLVTVSMFLVIRHGFIKPEPQMTLADKIGMLAISFPELVFFALYYILAIVNRRNAYDHMRYMIGTSLLLIAPGLGRALITNFGVPFPVAVMAIFWLEFIVALGLFLNDFLRRRSYRAFGVVALGSLLIALAWQFRMQEPWQSIGKILALLF